MTYHRATSADEAVALLARHEGARVIAGGTDIMVALRRAGTPPPVFVDVREAADSTRIGMGATIEIGAAVTHRAIERHAGLARLPALAEAARVVGGVQVRNLGTVGGNLVNASPAADLNPVLMTLDADALVATAGGKRSVPLAGFITGRGATVLGPHEVLAAVRFAAPPPGTGVAFLKAGRRRAMEIAVVNVAARLTLSNGAISTARIAVGAVGPVILRASDVEEALVGAQPDGETFAGVAAELARRAKPRDDVRASAEYRRHLVGVMVARALTRAAERAREDDAD